MKDNEDKKKVSDMKITRNLTMVGITRQRFLSALATLLIGYMVLAQPVSKHGTEPPAPRVAAISSTSSGSSSHRKDAVGSTYRKRGISQQKLMICGGGLVLVAACLAIIYYKVRGAKGSEKNNSSKVTSNDQERYSVVITPEQSPVPMDLVSDDNTSDTSEVVTTVQLQDNEILDEVSSDSENENDESSDDASETAHDSIEFANSPGITSNNLARDSVVIAPEQSPVSMELVSDDNTSDTSEEVTVDPSWQDLLNFLKIDKNKGLIARKVVDAKIVAPMIPGRMQALDNSVKRKQNKEIIVSKELDSKTVAEAIEESMQSSLISTDKDEITKPARCTFEQAVAFYRLMEEQGCVPDGFKACIGKIGAKELGSLLGQNKQSKCDETTKKIKELRGKLIDCCTTMGQFLADAKKVSDHLQNDDYRPWGSLFRFFKDKPYFLLLLYKDDVCFADAIRDILVKDESGIPLMVVRIFETLIKHTGYTPTGLSVFVKNARKKAAKQINNPTNNPNNKRSIQVDEAPEPPIERLQIRLSSMLTFFKDYPEGLLGRCGDGKSFADDIADTVMKWDSEEEHKEFPFPLTEAHALLDLMEKAGYVPPGFGDFVEKKCLVAEKRKKLKLAKRNNDNIADLMMNLKDLLGNQVDTTTASKDLKDRQWEALFKFFDTDPCYLLLAYNEARACFADAIAKMYNVPVEVEKKDRLSFFTKSKKDLPLGGIMPNDLIPKFYKLMESVGYIPKGFKQQSRVRSGSVVSSRSTDNTKKKSRDRSKSVVSTTVKRNTKKLSKEPHRLAPVNNEKVIQSQVSSSSNPSGTTSTMVSKMGKNLNNPVTGGLLSPKR